MKQWKITAALTYLKLYHKDAYPDDGNWDDWYYGFAPVMSADVYVLLVTYRQKPGQGDLYSKRTFSGLELHYLDEVQFLQKLRDSFDEMRVEIIETLDGLVKPEYRQEYPDPSDPFDWKQQRNFKVVA